MFHYKNLQNFKLKLETKEFFKMKWRQEKEMKNLKGDEYNNEMFKSCADKMIVNNFYI